MLLLLLLLLFLLYSQLLSSPKSQGTTFHTQRSSETSRAITGVYPSPPVHTLGFIAIRGCSMPPAARPFSSSFANLRFRAFGDVKRPHAGQYKQTTSCLFIDFLLQLMSVYWGLPLYLLDTLWTLLSGQIILINWHPLALLSRQFQLIDSNRNQLFR